MNKHDLVMKSYYKERAPIYDRVYSYPERQKDLRYLEKYIPQQFAGKDVLEVAAGTGYWSQFINKLARSLLATDATIEALEQINNRNVNPVIPIRVLDAYSLDQLEESFSGFFSGLWLSHVLKQDLKTFFESIQQCLKPGATVLLIDNSMAQCDKLPISATDEEGNTFQDRILDNGTVHRVLKNFPTEQELLELTCSYTSNQNFIQLEHFWLFQYQIQ